MKRFLINELGKKEGKKLFLKEQARFFELLSQNADKSKDQYKTLKTRILPRIALYQVLQDKMGNKEESLEIVRKYFLKEVQKIVNLVHITEKLPNFYKLFCRIFSKTLQKDNWQIDMLQNDNEVLAFNINKCLWFDTCNKYDCPEMCEMFCESDFLCYGSMKKISFERSQTLGTGGNCCDFKFINNTKTKLC